MRHHKFVPVDIKVRVPKTTPSPISPGVHFTKTGNCNTMELCGRNQFDNKAMK